MSECEWVDIDPSEIKPGDVVRRVGRSPAYQFTVTQVSEFGIHRNSAQLSRDPYRGTWQIRREVAPEAEWEPYVHGESAPPAEGDEIERVYLGATTSWTHFNMDGKDWSQTREGEILHLSRRGATYRIRRHTLAEPEPVPCPDLTGLTLGAVAVCTCGHVWVVANQRGEWCRADAHWWFGPLSIAKHHDGREHVLTVYPGPDLGEAKS